MSIPSRLRKENFYRFEPVFRACLQAPSTIEVLLPPLSPRTIAARLRDAQISLRTFHWSTDLSVEAVCALKVFERDNKVWLGLTPPKNHDEVKASTPLTVHIHSAHPWDESCLAALALLIERGCIQGGLTLPFIPEPSTITRLESTYNISLTSNVDTQTTLII